ncbi:MAG: ABC transporter permease [Deltaproteobacteria bacterium]|nr:ABC transporter permease [Deltaproteobacteria bacterium]MDZ4343543.1 ABC transporter permease [Candidatus Binatia bacterium]
MAIPSDEQLIAELGLRRQRPWSIYDHPNVIRGISIIVFLSVWEIYGRRTDPILFTYPTAVAVAFGQLVASGELIRQLLVSLSAMAAGFILSLVLGVGLGLAMGRSRLAEAVLEPHINALYATPQVALTPLLMMWLGLGFSVKVSVVFLFAFFPILINTSSGAKNVSASLMEVGRAYLASRRQNLIKIVLPAALPFIMAGIRIAVGRALVGMIIAELFTAITGLGAMLSLYGNIFETAKMFVVIIVLAMLGIGLIHAAQMLERKMAQWKETERAVG